MRKRASEKGLVSYSSQGVWGDAGGDPKISNTEIKSGRKEKELEMLSMGHMENMSKDYLGT